MSSLLNICVPHLRFIYKSCIQGKNGREWFDIKDGILNTPVPTLEFSCSQVKGQLALPSLRGSAVRHQRWGELLLAHSLCTYYRIDMVLSFYCIPCYDPVRNRILTLQSVTHRWPPQLSWVQSKQSRNSFGCFQFYNSLSQNQARRLTFFFIMGSNSPSFITLWNKNEILDMFTNTSQWSETACDFLWRFPDSQSAVGLWNE